MKKNKINKNEAIQIMESYGIKIKEHNFYQFRITHIETGHTWDWYHTTGSLVWNYPYSKSMKSIRNPEECAMYIVDNEL